MILLNFLIFIFLFNIIFFLYFNKICNYLNLFDTPNNRKIHKYPIPSIGGFIFLFNLIFFFIFDFINTDVNIFYFFSDVRTYFFFILSSFFVFLVGLKDDFKETNPYIKIFIFIFIISFYLLSEKSLINVIKFDYLKIFFSLGKQNFLFTLLCVAAFMNAFNMFDGINNQSSIFLLVFSIYVFLISSNFLLFLSLLIPIIFFSIKNYQNKVFLGNNGSYLISFVISIFLIKIYNYHLLNISAELVICIVIVPVIDMIRLFIIRILNKKSPFDGDRLHIHHLLLNKFGNLKTNFIIFLNLAIPLIIYIFFKKEFFSLVISITIYCLLFINLFHLL